MTDKITLFIEGEGGVGKTSVLRELLSHGWDVYPELPTLFPRRFCSHILNHTDRRVQLREQQDFLHMEVERYSAAVKSNTLRQAFDRSFLSTLAYSYAIEQYWRIYVYESTLSLLFDLLEYRRLRIPHLLVLLEAPLEVRQQRCFTRDSKTTPSSHGMEDRELHESEVFSGALTHFYSVLPERIDQLLPYLKIKSADVTTQEIARQIHHSGNQIESTPPEPPLAALFDALSNPSDW